MACGQPIKYSKADILERLKDLGRELGRAPAHSDVVGASSREGYPNVTTIVRNFGRFSTALKEAGVDSKGERRQRIRGRLISQFQELARELKRIPTSTDSAPHRDDVQRL